MRHDVRRAGWFVLCLLLSTAGLFATITFTPSQPNVDQTVTFTLTTTGSPISFLWDFGDGTTAGGSPVVNKIYRTAGTFQVRVTYGYMTMPKPITETTTITVYERRLISYSPANPQVNQTVTFVAQNFLSPSIRWDFGDGTAPVLAGVMTTHIYSYPSVFQVRAWDLGGTSPTAITVSVTVAVNISQRRIQLSPLYPVAGKPVMFTAVSFFTTNILWDFGDGSPPQAGPVQIVHTYVNPGTYIVRAWDWGGAYGGPTSMSITVGEALGPRAAFQIFFLQLRFDDGKSYKVVPKDYPGLAAFADIKYEGTGMFRAEWLVDGAPFRTITRALPFAADMTMDSSGALPGQTSLLPGFPTNMPGMHEVGLRIYEPVADFIVPIIRYFVSADPEVRPQDLKGVRLDVESIHGLGGVGCTLNAGGLEVPAGRYVILEGAVKYDLAKLVKFALLRIHLETELVDQQFLRDLGPGEERTFRTSFLNPSPEPKRLYITIYDLDGPKADLVYFQKILVYAPGE